MPRSISPGDSSAFATEFGGYLSRDGLECLHIFEGSIERALINLAPNKPVADGNIGGGTPTMGAGGAWIALDGSNFLEINPGDTPDFTVYSLVRSFDTMADLPHCPTYWSNGLNLPANGEGSLSFGNRLAAQFGGVELFGAGFGNNVSDDESRSTTVAVTHTAWHLLVMKVYSSGANQGVTLRNVTTSTDAVPATTAKPRFPVIGKWRVGSVKSQTLLGTSQQKWFLKYNKITTVDEDARNIAQIREYEKSRWGLVGF